MSIAPEVFWPYFGGAAALAVGIGCKGRTLRQVRGIEALVRFGPVFLAIGMAVFGADHLTQPTLVSGVVPPWMPWRLFWAIFVGFALLAAALGLATGIRARWAAGGLGGMIFSFALLIFLPWWLKSPTDRVRATLLLRDLTLGWSCLAFAAGSGARPAAGGQRRSGQGAGPIVVAVARLVVAVGIGVYGVLQCLHPEAAPGIPADGPMVVTMPAWIPAHAAWSYATGVLFGVCAAGLLTSRHARRAAVTLGVVTCALIAIVYIPWTLANAGNVGKGLDYLAIHFALAGAMLLLAAALPNRAASKPDRPAQAVLGTAQSWSE